MSKYFVQFIFGSGAKTVFDKQGFTLAKS
jgi:hypothetical protein